MPEDFGLPFPQYSTSLNLEMKAAAYLLFATVLITVLPVQSYAAPTMIREPGALYIEDATDRAVQLPALRDSPIYYNSDLKRFLGTIRA